jgi:hypothetical protein
MSSVLKSYSQIPVRVKYLIAVADDDGAKIGVGADGVSAFTLDPGTFLSLGSIATESVVEALPDNSQYTLEAGNLFKDLGRQITILDADNATHLAVYRQVQLVSGAGSEGVADDAPSYEANIFVRVWAADGKNVVVARTG